MQCMLVITIHACILNTSCKNITEINSVGMGVAKSNETRNRNETRTTKVRAMLIYFVQT